MSGSLLFEAGCICSWAVPIVFGLIIFIRVLIITGECRRVFFRYHSLPLQVNIEKVYCAFCCRRFISFVIMVDHASWVTA